MATKLQQKLVTTILSTDEDLAVLVDELDERAQADLLVPDPVDEESEATLKALGVKILEDK